MADFVRPGATLKRARTKTLEIAYEDSGPESGLPVLLMHGFPYDPRAYDDMVPPLGRGRLPRHRALSARLRPDAVPLGPDAALRPAGGARPGSPRPHGCAAHPHRAARRLRLGRARCLRRLGAVAGAGARPRHRRRLQHPEHRGLGRAGGAGSRTPDVVPVLLPHRARPRRAHQEPRCAVQAVVAAVVADLEVRRRDLPAHARRRSTIPISSTS